MPGDRKNPYPVSHDDVLTLSCYVEPGFLERAHCIEVMNTWDLWHGSDRDFDFSDFRTLYELSGHLKVLSDGVFDVLESFFLGLALRPAAGQADPLPWHDRASAVFSARNIFPLH